MCQDVHVAYLEGCDAKEPNGAADVEKSQDAECVEEELLILATVRPNAPVTVIRVI